MGPERFPTDPEGALREKVRTSAEKHRVNLEKAIPQEGTPEYSEGGAHRFARITVESYGRALLDTGEHLSRAVELLALAGALEKNDIQAQLAKALERLSKSSKEEDEEELVKASERLLSSQ